MLNKVLGKFSQDIGIDLGTANTLVYVGKKGIVINEPSVVAINKKTGRVLAIGEEARRMVGKTPAHIVASRPLVDGVVSDFEITQQMLKYFIDKVHSTDMMHFLPRPRVVVGIPSGVTEVERRAVEDAAYGAGAREVYLIEEPMAAALGARLNVQEPSGHMIVDIGGGTTEVAVISLGGIVTAQSLRIAGDKLNEDIIHFAREEYNLLLGERTAENIKIDVGSAMELEEPLAVPMRGRDLVTGLPKEIIIQDKDVRKALLPSLTSLAKSIKATVEQTPPELLADIMERGIILTGGGSLLRRFDELVQEEVQIPVYIAEDPLTAVARGTGVVLENLDKLKEVLVDVELHDKPPAIK
ncbi:MAG: rod shape-determining protein [Candidatus Spechtbacterales bacterium]|nr:rod shape-determining protein [Candidatus Spechtbacterales bacterium]